MKSSNPLFTRQNPFPSTSKVGRTHYYPSPTQSLSTKNKKTSLSPIRSNQQPPAQPPSKNLKKKTWSSEKDVCGMKTAHEQPDFSESWPSTEDGSSPASISATSDVQTYAQKAAAEKLGSSSESGVQENSTLAKYIERFRHGRPRSREERQQSASAFGEEEMSFWWRTSPSLLSTSTPNQTRDNDHSPDHRHGDRSPSPSRESVSSDTFHSDSEVIEILQLQERARRLLLRGEGTLSEDSVPVSSEGLGSSDFSPPVSVEEPVRRPQIPAVTKPPGVIPNLASSKLPEDDILFQWRLRRKMEQARDWSQSQQQQSRHGNAFSWQPPVSLSPPAGEDDHPHKLQPGRTQLPEFSQKDPCPHISAPGPGPFHCGPPSSSAFIISDSSVSHQPLAHVPAHMHFLCDVLPCSMQSSHGGEQKKTSHKMHAIRSNIDIKNADLTVNKANIFAAEPICERTTTRVSSEAAENERLLRNKMFGGDLKVKTQGKDVPGQGKKSKKKPKEPIRNTTGAEQTDGRNSSKRSTLQQKPPKKDRQETDEHVAPPSPVHKALAQAVSEVLFPPVDPSPDQRLAVSAVPSSSRHSTPTDVSTSQQTPGHQCDMHTSAEVIAQLLHEAEDSDEKEFEDDPLLQVLRKQRKWVKGQISDVDSLLAASLDVRHVT